MVVNNPKPQYTARFVNPHHNAPMYACPTCDTKFPMAALTISDGFNLFIKSAPSNIDRVEILVENEKYRLIDDAMIRFVPKKKSSKSNSKEVEEENEDDEIIVLLSSDEEEEQEKNDMGTNQNNNGGILNNNNVNTPNTTQNTSQNANQSIAVQNTNGNISQNASQNASQILSQNRSQNTGRAKSQTNQNGSTNGRAVTRYQNSQQRAIEEEKNSVFEETTRMLNEKFQNNGTGASWDDPVVID